MRSLESNLGSCLIAFFVLSASSKRTKPKLSSATLLYTRAANRVSVWLVANESTMSSENCFHLTISFTADATG